MANFIDGLSFRYNELSIFPGLLFIEKAYFVRGIQKIFAKPMLPFSRGCIKNGDLLLCGLEFISKSIDLINCYPALLL